MPILRPIFLLSIFRSQLYKIGTDLGLKARKRHVTQIWSLISQKPTPAHLSRVNPSWDLAEKDMKNTYKAAGGEGNIEAHHQKINVYE